MGRENLPNPIQVKGPALGGLRNPIQVNGQALGLMQARKRDFQVIVNQQHSCTHYSIQNSKYDLTLDHDVWDFTIFSGQECRIKKNTEFYH